MTATSTQNEYDLFMVQFPKDKYEIFPFEEKPRQKGSRQVLTFTASSDSFIDNEDGCFLKVLVCPDLHYKDRTKFINNQSSLTEPLILSHLNQEPHILKLKDHNYWPRKKNGTEQGLYFLMYMEKLDSLDIRFMEYEDEHGISDIPLSELCRLAADICRALIEAQNVFRVKYPPTGICHCDIKSDNLFYDPKSDCYKLGDWDGAFIPAIHKTVLAGTPPYMAPEQLAVLLPASSKLQASLGKEWTDQWLKQDSVFNGSVPDTRSDLYSLGIVLYEWCASRFPFTRHEQSETDYDAYRTQMEGDPNKWKAELARIAEEEKYRPLVHIIKKAAAWNPADRYQSPEEMLDALNQVYEQATGDVLVPELPKSKEEKQPAAPTKEEPAPAPTPASVPESASDRCPYTIDCSQNFGTCTVIVSGSDPKIWGCFVTGTDLPEEAEVRARYLKQFRFSPDCASDVSLQLFDLSRKMFRFSFSAKSRGILLLFDAYSNLIGQVKYSELLSEA